MEKDKISPLFLRIYSLTWNIDLFELFDYQSSDENINFCRMEVKNPCLIRRLKNEIRPISFSPDFCNFSAESPKSKYENLILINKHHYSYEICPSNKFPTYQIWQRITKVLYFSYKNI